MTEMVLDTRTLPESLFALIRTSTVKVRANNGIINLIPITESEADCPIRGIAADCGFTVDDFLSRKSEEKVLKGA